MQPKHNPVLLGILALAFASLACQAVSGTTEPPATQASQPPEQLAASTPTEASSQQPAVEPATVASQGVGILCAGSTTGLSCLNESGWQVYTDENSDLPNPYLYAGAVCPDGQFAIAQTTSLSGCDEDHDQSCLDPRHLSDRGPPQWG